MPRPPNTLYHPTPWYTFFSFPNWLFTLFIPLGLILFYTLFLIPTQNVLHARSWLPTPCTILSSSIQSHHSSKSTTYSPQIRYQYQFNQKPYTGSRFTFAPDFSTSSYDSVVKDIKPFRPRTQSTCYINPTNPADSVLLRNFTPTFFLGLAPLLFTLAGSSALTAQLATFLHARHPTTTQSPAPRRLHSNHQPFSNFFGFFLATAMFLLVFCVFFNDCLAGWQNHFPNIPLTLALFLLALFTLTFIFATVSCFLTLFRNPRITLTLSTDPLTPSIPATLTYRLTPLFSFCNPKSAIRNVRRLRIDLVGFIDTATSPTAAFNKSPFTRISLLDTTDPTQFPTGSLPFTPPPGPPSLFLPHNRIRWTFSLQANLSHDPNPLDLSFPTHLLPPPPPLSGRADGPPLSSTNQSLTLSLPHTTYPRTTPLTGTASYPFPTPHSLTLTLFLHTTGRGLPESRLLSQSQIPLSSSSPHPFSFPLPPTLSPSHTHELLSLHYSLELSATSTFSTRLDFQVA